MRDFVRLDPDDNVVTATHVLQAGVAANEAMTTDLIPSGHKIATRQIAEGEQIRKYAQFIGLASRGIAPEDRRDTFMGYRRENGRVGTRNHIAVATSVNCSRRCSGSCGAMRGIPTMPVFSWSGWAVK